MKQAIVIFIASLIIGAGINGLLFSVPAYSVKPGVLNVSQSSEASGMKRSESMMPEVNMKDGYRPIQFMHRIEDSDSYQQTEFPMQALQ